ncbi:hypothetical protein Osc1_10780 [Hominimerdicola sp. 21CYCFAH17_S]
MRFINSVRAIISTIVKTKYTKSILSPPFPYPILPEPFDRQYSDYVRLEDNRLPYRFTFSDINYIMLV